MRGPLTGPLSSTLKICYTLQQKSRVTRPRPTLLATCSLGVTRCSFACILNQVRPLLMNGRPVLPVTTRVSSLNF
ncbi:hypothetical protein ACQRIU_000513 [Beauveria bassiana]